MTKPTGPRHERPPGFRKLRPGRPHTLEPARMTPHYTKLLESIWAVLSYNKEPCWVYVASDWACHIEHNGSVLVVSDRWDHALKEATKINLDAMKASEAHSDRTGVAPRYYPLFDCAVAWHLAGYYSLSPWLMQARLTNIYDRDTTALEYVKATLPVLAEWPAETTEMAQRLAAHHNARLFR